MGSGSLANTRVSDAMRHGVLTCRPDESLARAAQMMAEHEVTHVVVVSGERPIGVLSSLDVAASLARG
jgi:CBS domain-containing protein